MERNMIISDITLESEEEIAKDILLCLKLLYSTVAGTQPMDREFGIDANYMDMPADAARNQYALEIIAKTEIYEPRVKVQGVTFHMDEGVLKPVIQLRRVG